MKKISKYLFILRFFCYICIMKNKQYFRRLKELIFGIPLPVDGSYIEMTEHYQFGSYTWKGIVRHHDDGKSFYIDEKNSVICTITKKDYEKALSETRVIIS